MELWGRSPGVSSKHHFDDADDELFWGKNGEKERQRFSTLL